MQESFNRFLLLFDEAERSVEVILLAPQSNSTGSVLINDDTLGAGIKVLKLGVAAPSTALDIPLAYYIKKEATVEKFLKVFKHSLVGFY